MNSRKINNITVLQINILYSPYILLSIYRIFLQITTFFLTTDLLRVPVAHVLEVPS